MSDRVDFELCLKGELPKDAPILGMLENAADYFDPTIPGVFRFNGMKHDQMILDLMAGVQVSWALYAEASYGENHNLTIFNHKTRVTETFSTDGFCGEIMLGLTEISNDRLPVAQAAWALINPPFKLTSPKTYRNNWVVAVTEGRTDLSLQEWKLINAK